MLKVPREVKNQRVSWGCSCRKAYLELEDPALRWLCPWLRSPRWVLAGGLGSALGGPLQKADWAVSQHGS